MANPPWNDPTYRPRTDKMGLKFRKGFRTALVVQGTRPATRSHKRPLRPR